VLATVNGVLADFGVNIEGQMLSTRGELGYVITDTGTPLSSALLDPAVRARFRVVAAGDGDAERLRALVTAAGVDDTVDVLGWIGRDERDALLARAGLLVLPSSHEGLPMAVLEAMAWGVVPVVTPVGGLPEVVLDGVNGVHVPVGDPPALAAALSALVTDPARRAELGDRARADVAALSSEQWGRRLGEVWAETAA